MPENHNCINMKTSDDYWKKRKKKLYVPTERQSESQEVPIQHSPEVYGGKIKKKNKFLSNLKYKWNNFKYRSKKRSGSKIDLPIGFILGLFVPLFIALLVMYLLEPGMTYISQFFGTNNTIQFLLLFLLVPAQAQSIVPWIAWIIAGFIGGYLSKKILIPFISMYVLIWLILFIFQGNLIQQQFSMIGILGLEQIVIQVLVLNIIYSVLAFGFGGWIGASIGGSYHRSYYTKKSTVIAASVVVIILIITGLFYAGFFEGINLGSNDSYKLGDSVVDGNVQYTFVSAGWEKYSDYNPDEFFYFEVKGTNIGNEKTTGTLKNFVFETQNGYRYASQMGDTVYLTFVLNPGRNSTQRGTFNYIDKAFLPVTKAHFRIGNYNVLDPLGTSDQSGREITVNLE